MILFCTSVDIVVCLNITTAADIMHTTFNILIQIKQLYFYVSNYILYKICRSLKLERLNLFLNGCLSINITSMVDVYQKGLTLAKCQHKQKVNFQCD